MLQLPPGVPVAWLVFLHWAMNSAMSFFVFVFVPLLPVALSGWAAPLEASAKARPSKGEILNAAGEL